MSNSYYTKSGAPAPNAAGTSNAIRSEFSNLQDAFDAVETAINGKATTAQGTKADTAVQSVNAKTGTSVTLVKADLSLGNVDNTSDASKPVSTLTQTALDLKATIASPTFTGVPAAPTAAGGTNTTQIATTAFVTQTAFASTLPDQTGNNGKVLTTDGANASWTAAASGTVTSVAMSVPAFLSVANSPVTSAGTLAVSYSGTALPAANGGTGITSYTIGDILFASGAAALSALADVATGNVLVSGGIGVAPAWGKVSLSGTQHVSGTLPVGNGGTGAITLTGVLKGNGTSAFTAASAGTDFVAPGGALGTPSSGTLSSCTADGTNAVGFKTVPQNSKSAAYTLVLGDAGYHILHPSADTTARIFTIPANASVAYPIGTAITFVNQNAAGVLTIAITTDTMRLAGAGTTGSRTLAANGTATALKITSTEWIISGTGLT